MTASPGPASTTRRRRPRPVTARVRGSRVHDRRTFRQCRSRSRARRACGDHRRVVPPDASSRIAARTSSRSSKGCTVPGDLLAGLVTLAGDQHGVARARHRRRPRRIAARRSPSSSTSAPVRRPRARPASTAARIAAGSSERGLSSVTTSTSASRAADRAHHAAACRGRGHHRRRARAAAGPWSAVAAPRGPPRPRRACARSRRPRGTPGPPRSAPAGRARHRRRRCRRPRPPASSPASRGQRDGAQRVGHVEGTGQRHPRRDPPAVRRERR